MKTWLATACISAALLLSATTFAQQEVVLDRIVAVVNDGVVLETDVATETEFVVSESNANGISLPAPAVLRERIIERLIDQTIQRQEAARVGIAADSSSVNRTIAQIARGNNMNTQQFRDALLNQGFDYNHFRRSIEQQIIVERLIQRVVQARVRVSEQEIDDYLKAAENNASGQSQYRLRHILIAVPSSADADAIDAANEKADTLLKELAAGADFATVAASTSDGSRALQGGDLGLRRRQELPAFINSVLDSMDVDDVRGPIRSPNGLHIIKLIEKEAGAGPAQQETRIRHIFVASEDTTAPEELLAGRARLVDGESFAAVALEVSEDPNSSNTGGELPWFGRGQFPPALEQAADKLEVGVLSEPFRTQYGWHVVEVLERRERTRTSTVARAEADASLRQRKVEQEADRWIRQLRDESFVELRNP